jgi:restriction system protein
LSMVTALNEQGDQALRPRRQVLKRITEFDDFGSCYPDNQLKAKGAVATLAQLINKKDSFTRMDQAREAEERKTREAARLQAAEVAAKREALDNVKSDLFALFSEKDPHRRGKALEGVLNRLFAEDGIKIKEAFVVVDENGAGIIEQIDGAVEIDGTVYLVEMKWWKERLSRQEVGVHLASVFTRGSVGGILISNSGFHPSAVADCTAALSQKTVVLVELEEIVMALNQSVPIRELLRSKIQAAQLLKQPLTRPLQS